MGDVTTGWMPPDTAPKDRLIIADIGMPWACLAVWNVPSQKWCVTELECGLYQGEWNDVSISHTFESAEDLLGWLPLPELPGKEVAQ